MNRSMWRWAAWAVVAVAVGTGGVIVATVASAGADRALARAELHNAAGATIGDVTFMGHGVHADRVRVELSLPSDAPRLGEFHGFHIHSVGDCTAPSFASAGGHWNLDATATHGGHAGDLPSVLVAPDGRGYAEFETARFTVKDLFDADGSAVILHAGADNFGNVPLGGGKYEDPNGWYNAPTGTAKTGDAGSRYGCGLVKAQ